MSKRKLVSLFSGCGGLDLGFEGGFDVPESCIHKDMHPNWIVKKTRPGWVRLCDNPFQTVFANDIKPSAKIVWSRYFGSPPRSHPPGTFVLESIVDVVKKAEAGEGPLFGMRADVVTGGFPCQDFSLAGKRKGFQSKRKHDGEFIGNASIPTEESRGMLYFWMRKVIGLTEPKCFVAENVKGLVSMETVKETIERDFKSVGSEGYLVVPARVLNAPDYGVAQTRERVIFLGFNRSKMTTRAVKALERANIDPEFDPYPEPTHKVPGKKGESSDLFASRILLPAVTVREVVAGLGEPHEHPNDASHVAHRRNLHLLRFSRLNRSPVGAVIFPFPESPTFVFLSKRLSSLLTDAFGMAVLSATAGLKAIWISGIVKLLQIVQGTGVSIVN